MPKSDFLVEEDERVKAHAVEPPRVCCFTTSLSGVPRHAYRLRGRLSLYVEAASQRRSGLVG